LGYKCNILSLDFSKKQLYVTKTNLIKKTLYTISNGGFLKKISKRTDYLKKRFVLKNEYCKLFFFDLLQIEKTNYILVIKGYGYDIIQFFQKIERLKLTHFFKKLNLNFLGGYNLNKKKRVRSIKKRLKKSFLKYENNSLRDYLKKY
jgi:hypothetical protein